MSDDEREQRIQSALADEFETGKSAWYWLSFAAEEGFLGGCIVNAVGVTDAVRQAHVLGINPGGEVRIMEIPSDAEIKDEWKHKLLSIADMERLGMKPKKASDE